MSLRAGALLRRRRRAGTSCSFGCSAVGQESGAAAEARAAHEFTIRDGLLVRCQGVPRPRGGPRSRGAVGVGDVAGERGDVQRVASRRFNRRDLERLSRADGPRRRVVARRRTWARYRGHDGARAWLGRRLRAQLGTTSTSLRGAVDVGRTDCSRWRPRRRATARVERRPMIGRWPGHCRAGATAGSSARSTSSTTAEALEAVGLSE